MLKMELLLFFFHHLEAYCSNTDVLTLGFYNMDAWESDVCDTVGAGLNI